MFDVNLGVNFNCIESPPRLVKKIRAFSILSLAEKNIQVNLICFHSLIRTFAMNLEDTFARFEKY